MPEVTRVVTRVRVPAPPRAAQGPPRVRHRADTMVPGGPSWWLLMGFCVLVPPATTQGGPGVDVTARTRVEESGSHLARGEDPLCGVTFHTPTPCPHLGPPSSSSPRELEHLQTLLRATKATLRDLEVTATQEDNGTRYQDLITQALPSIHEANREFQESLDNVRRELEAHVAEVDHPRVAQRKEKLQQDVLLVAHMLRLTRHLAQNLEATSHQLLTQLSSATPSATTQP